MICNTPVAKRTYIEVTDIHDPTKKINVMTVRRNSNWRQPQKVEIEIDGAVSYIEPIVCGNCEKESLTREDILEKVKRGWEIENKAMGKKPQKIKSLKLKKRLKRK